MLLRRIVVGCFFAAVAAQPACAYRDVAVVRAASRTEGRAEVRVKRVSRDIFTFTVTNLSDEMLFVDRNRVRLSTPIGILLRKSGGAGTTYTIAPHGVHDVNVKFEIDALPEGAEVAALFDDALIVGETRVPIEPLTFRLQ